MNNTMTGVSIKIDVYFTRVWYEFGIIHYRKYKNGKLIESV